jgi:ribosome-associated translation inhibitor RaiA
VPTAVREVAEQDVIAAVDALVQSLQTERRRLARRLDDMERQLLALNGKLNASEPRLGEIRSHAGPR